MSKPTPIRGVLAGAIVALGCGSPVNAPENYSGDAYNGVIDGSALAPAFQPNSTDRTVCQGASSCYAPQVGWVAGHTITFYNALAVTSSNLPASLGPGLANRNSDGTGGFHLDTFRNAHCTPGPYDPVKDAFPTATQAPVFDALPAAPTSTKATALAYPIAAVYDVTFSGQCNDIKSHDSVPGLYGSARSASPVAYAVWLPMDPAAGLIDLTFAAAPMPLAWFKGLQLGAAGGPSNAIPQNDDGTFIAMDGAILNPGGSVFAKPTDKNAVILPYAPTDAPATATTAGWSPIVRLHNYTLPAGKKLGDIKGICLPGQTGCPSNHIAASEVGKGNPFNTIFIVASVQ
jgi:hypothetical protein